MASISSAPLNLVDAIDAKPIDLWDAWLFAEAEASLALANWTQAADGDKASGYTTYAAALDQEEQAARVLALSLGEQVAATSSR